MCIKKVIKDQNPLLTLKNNPYAYDIFGEEDFQLEVFELNEIGKYIIFKKRINGTIGYIFIVEKELLSIEEIKKIYNRYKEIVAKLSNNNFREVELVIICNKVEKAVLDSIKEYNQIYSHRSPISLILNLNNYEI